VPVGKFAHVIGVHDADAGGGTHDARSQIMNSRTFSCAVIGVAPQ
jgi:hypothetical protein